MPENAESSIVSVESRELPARITIPPIRGEMVHLRPATVADLDRMDAIDAYPGASGITGKDRVAERAAVHARVRRSVPGPTARRRPNPVWAIRNPDVP